MSFNPHPPMSAFPVVLASLVAGTEILSYFWNSESENLRKFAKLVLAISFIVSPLTYYSGYWGAEVASQSFHVSDELISYHQMFAKLYLVALVTCGLFALLELFDPEKRKSIKLAFSAVVVVNLLAAILVSRQGGILVFKHGAGVSLPKDQTILSPNLSPN